MEIIIIIFVTLEVLLLAILYLVFINGRKIRKEIKKMEDSIDTSRVNLYDAQILERLPEPVQRYFRFALKDGQKFINVAKIRQSGVTRLKEGQNWQNLKAVQYFNGQVPAFIWVASVKISHLSWVSAIDKYCDLRANMVVRFFSLFTAVNSSGAELDTSALIRYASEMPWFPTALLPSDFLEWEPLNEDSATAVIKHGAVKEKVTFHFKSNGEISRVTAHGRFRFAGGKYSKEHWTGYYKNYTEINDIKVPSEIEAEWNLKSGTFRYIKANIDKIEYS